MLKGLEYAFQNFYQPVFVHSNDSQQWLEDLLHSEQYGEALTCELKRHIIRHMLKYQKTEKQQNVLFVIDDSTDVPDKCLQNPVILNIEASSIENLAERIKQILPYTSRININILNLDNSFDLQSYEEQLKVISDILLSFLEKGEHKEVRQLTDRIFAKKMNNCFAGEKNITLAPDGKFYFCPAFYFGQNIDVDLEKAKKLTLLSKAPICDHCDAYQCNRCIYKNYAGTGELNTPTKIQCLTAHLERKVSAELLKKLQEKNLVGYRDFRIPYLYFDDPIDQFDKRIMMERRGY